MLLVNQVFQAQLVQPANQEIEDSQVPMDYPDFQAIEAYLDHQVYQVPQAFQVWADKKVILDSMACQVRKVKVVQQV